MGESHAFNSGENRFYWNVAFTNISIIKAWLGWHPDNQTTPGTEQPYNMVTVVIDAVTGEYLLRKVYFAPFIGGPGMTPSTETPWSPPLTTAPN